MEPLAVLAILLFVRGVLNRYLRDIFNAAFPTFYAPQRIMGPEGPGEWQHFFQRRLHPFYADEARGGSNTFLFIIKATIHAMATSAITQLVVFSVFAIFHRAYVLELAGSPSARAQIYHGIQDSWHNTLVLQYSKSRQEMYVSHQMDSPYIDLSPTEGRALETMARFRLDQSRVFPYNEPAWGMLDAEVNRLEGHGKPLLKIISPGGRARLHLHKHAAVYILERANQRVRVEYDQTINGDPLGAFMNKFCITYDNGVFGTTRTHKRGFLGNGYGIEQSGDLVECSKWTIENGVRRLLSEDMAGTADSTWVPFEVGEILAPFFGSVFSCESCEKFKSLLAYALLSSAAVKLSLQLLEGREVSFWKCYYVVVFGLSPYAFLAACWPAFLSDDSRESPWNLLFCFVFSVYMYCMLIEYTYVVDKEERRERTVEQAAAPGAEAVAEPGHPDEAVEGDRAGVDETVAATGRGEDQETVEERRQDTPPTFVSAEHEDQTVPQPKKTEAVIKDIKPALTGESDGERAGVVVTKATTVSAAPEEPQARPRAPVLHASQIGTLPDDTPLEKAYEDLKGRMDKLVDEYGARTEALEMKVRNLTNKLDASAPTSEAMTEKVALLQVLAGMPSPGGEQRQGVVDQEELLKRLEEKTGEYFQTLAECAEAEKVRKEADAALHAQRTAFMNEQRLFREKVEVWEHRRMQQENTVRPTATILPDPPSVALSQDDEVEVEQLRRKLKNLRAMAADLERAVSLDEQHEIMEAQQLLSPLALSTWSEEQVRERLEALHAERVVLEIEEEKERFAQRPETDELSELYAKKTRLEQQFQAAQNGPDPSPDSSAETPPETLPPSPEVPTQVYPQVSPDERIDALLETRMPGKRAFEATGVDRKVSFREHIDRMRRYAQMRYIFQHCTDEELVAFAETEKSDQKIPPLVLDAVWRAKGRAESMLPPSSQESEKHIH